MVAQLMVVRLRGHSGGIGVETKICIDETLCRIESVTEEICILKYRYIYALWNLDA